MEIREVHCTQLHIDILVRRNLCDPKIIVNDISLLIFYALISFWCMQDKVILFCNHLVNF